MKIKLTESQYQKLLNEMRFDGKSTGLFGSEEPEESKPINEFGEKFKKGWSEFLSAAKREVQLAYELHPDSVVLLDTIGYVMALSGEWEQGTELISKAIRRNPYHGAYVHYALWANWIRQKNYEQAYQETMHFRRPQIFWEPLAKASTPRRPLILTPPIVAAAI